jgi:hypothetical protein
MIATAVIAQPLVPALFQRWFQHLLSLQHREWGLCGWLPPRLVAFVEVAWGYHVQKRRGGACCS